MDPTGAVIAGEFEVRPAFFQLNTNEDIILEIIFVPVRVGHFEQSFILVCDNCQVSGITLSGIKCVHYPF